MSRQVCASTPVESRREVVTNTGQLRLRPALHLHRTGDAVNLAARIESLTKTYGLDILVSETTAAAIPDFARLEADRVVARGRSQETVLHSLPAAARSWSG